MSFIYNMADTWNAIGTTFNSILMNISDGAGGAPVGSATSKYINIQRNSVPILSGLITGQLISNDANTYDLTNTLNVPAADGRFIGLTSGGNSSYYVISYGGDAVYRGNAYGGTVSAITATPSARRIAAIAGGGYDGTAIQGGKGLISIVASELWSATANGCDVVLSATKATTTTRADVATFKGNGSSLLGIQAALVTNATDGFTYIPTCAGTPTGTPTAFTGLIPMVYDTTNHQFWFYDGGGWKQPKTPAAAAIVTWQ